MNHYDICQCWLQRCSMALPAPAPSLPLRFLPPLPLLQLLQPPQPRNQLSDGNYTHMYTYTKKKNPFTCAKRERFEQRWSCVDVQSFLWQAPCITLHMTLPCPPQQLPVPRSSGQGSSWQWLPWSALTSKREQLGCELTSPHYKHERHPAWSAILAWEEIAVCSTGTQQYSKTFFRLQTSIVFPCTGLIRIVWIA